MSIPSIPSTDFYDQHDGINRCYACDDPRFKKHRHITHFGFPIDFYRCECGLIKQVPMPNEDFFDWFFNQDLFYSSKETSQEYVWGYYDYFKDEADRMATSEWRYRRLKDILDSDKPMKMMKIGPATGTFLYVANKHGHQAIGCDVSDQFREYARVNYNVQIDQGRFENQPYVDEQFDAVFLFNVIENVPNQEEFLAAIFRTLKLGGYFILNYVNMHQNLIEAIQRGKYFIYRPPVCYAFPRNTLFTVLDKYGYKVIERFRDRRVLSVEKVLSLLGWKRALTLSRSLKLNRLSFHLYAYPSEVIVAQKREL